MTTLPSDSMAAPIVALSSSDAPIPTTFAATFQRLGDGF
jgi:hypothetical protein